MQPKSFCPVSLLPVASKILERVVFLQIVDYMDTNQMFHPNHHAFRSLHSTITAMIQMYDTWLEALERGEMAGVTIIDQSAAFDCVDLELFLAKLKIYGWAEGSLKWMES